MADLVPLPPQATDVPWPSDDWPRGTCPVDLSSLVATAFDDDGPIARTLGLLVVHRGRIVVERYADGVDASTTLISWSMAKSILHAAVGILVGEGRLSLDRPAPVRWWGGDDDPRRAITLDHLLQMRDGLAFVEDYVDDGVSDVIAMLFGEGADDVARFAAERPLAHDPGTHFNYSSGTSNVVSSLVADLVGRGDDYVRWLRERLFGPIGMRSAEPRLDAAGTFIASSYVYATAQDFARFGLLYLRDGVWGDRRLLPEGWVDHARRIRSVDQDGNRYGAHWWCIDDRFGTFYAGGYEGQTVTVVPALDLVVVRLGKMPAERADAFRAWRIALIEAFA